MKKLPVNWVLQNWGDEELPQYHLLNYVQSIYTELQNVRLFPAWENIYSDYLQLKTLNNELKLLQVLQPTIISGMDIEKTKWIYEIQSHRGQEEFEAVKKRLNFALPIIKKTCKMSEFLRKEVESEINFGPLGVLVANKREGLIFITSTKAEVYCWSYSCSIQTEVRNSYTALRTKFVGRYHLGITDNIYAIKDKSSVDAGLKGLMFSSWVVDTKHPFPVFHTLKPIAIMQLSKELGI